MSCSRCGGPFEKGHAASARGDGVSIERFCEGCTTENMKAAMTLKWFDWRSPMNDPIENKARELVNGYLAEGFKLAKVNGWKPKVGAPLEENAKSLIKAGLEQVVPKLADEGLLG